MEQQLNSDIFLSTFNELEKHFKNELFRGTWKSFKQMLKEGSRFNPIVNRFKEDLFEFTDLRNAIVHNSTNDYRVIAEPHTFVVEHFIEIKNQIINPKQVDAFSKKVHSCKLNDPISVPLKLIHDFQISQIPVFDEKNSVVEVLNAGTIAKWLAAKKQVAIDLTKVSELLDFKDYKHNFEIVSKRISVYHAAEIFKNSHKKKPMGRYYDALLISKNGKPDEEIKGIIVLSDIAEYM